MKNKNNKLPERQSDNRQNNNKILKKVIILLINLTICLLVYKTILLLGDKISLWFYYIGITLYLTVASVILCAFYFKNGFKFSTAPTPHSNLPADWSPAEKTEFLEKEAKKTESAKKLLLVLLPMIVTIIINYLELMLPELLKALKG